MGEVRIVAISTLLSHEDQNRVDDLKKKLEQAKSDSAHAHRHLPASFEEEARGRVQGLEQAIQDIYCPPDRSRATEVAIKAANRDRIPSSLCKE